MVFSSTANIILEFLFKLKIKDYTNGYRFYSRRAINVLINKKKFVSEQFLILSEILIILNNKNFKINEIESVFVNRIRGESSVNLGLILNSFLSMLKLYWKYRF